MQGESNTGLAGTKQSRTFMILSASAFSVAASRSRRAVLISFIAFITCGNGARGRMPRAMAPTKGKGGWELNGYCHLRVHGHPAKQQCPSQQSVQIACLLGQRLIVAFIYLRSRGEVGDKSLNNEESVVAHLFLCTQETKSPRKARTLAV